jgi:hypothetical protein
MTPFETQQFIFDKLHLCGCADWDSALAEVRRVLEWAEQDMVTRPDWTTLFPSEGLYYLIMSHLDDIDLIEHGTAIRHCWLAKKGDEFLAALRQYTVKEIEDAEDPED